MPAVHSIFVMSAAATGLSWLCFKVYEYELGSFESTPLVAIEDLLTILDPNGTPQRVAIEGVVACDDPIETKHRPGSPALLILYSVTKVAHFVSRGFLWWTEDEKQTVTRASVPFRVVPDSTTSVRPSDEKGNSRAIQAPLSQLGVLIPALDTNPESSNLSELLTVVGDVTVQNQFTFDTFRERMRSSGRMHRSSQYIESGLEVGSPITILGPVSVTRDGKCKMVAQPSVVTHKTRYQLIMETEDSTRFWQWSFYIGSGITTLCVAYMASQYLREYWEDSRARRRLDMFRGQRNFREEKQHGEEKSGIVVDDSEPVKERKAADAKTDDEDVVDSCVLFVKRLRLTL
eukprot:CAMPEP_0114523684 /NCGR_PEP_ID=MMETSP0109-20121206/21426_1 /TAXON_ID=29199 /ORGANISM="Chlorarachnion reptans, Strain CCCM449" /LENGTH=345 /DNA_ID=CAMNT_0001705023 /DNA_START=128 /DNA_END=1166 /DNA_ORIENTATION=-